MDSNRAEWPLAAEGSNYTMLAALGFEPSVDDVWRDAEAAVRILSESETESVLLARSWDFEALAHCFAYYSIYVQVATEAGLAVRECARQWMMGSEHLLFFVKNRHMTDDELLSSVP